MNELVNDAREGTNLRQSLTVADLPHNAAPMSREQLNEQKRKDKLKRKLKLSLSNCSSQHSGEQEEAPLAGLTAPESATKKEEARKGGAEAARGGREQPTAAVFRTIC